LVETADRLDRDPDTARGRTASADAVVARALAHRDAAALDALASTYDQEVPDPDAALKLRFLADRETPIVGYLGKLIPQKGVELLLAAHSASRHRAACLVVGFGSYREWLAALAMALRNADRPALAWLREITNMPIELSGQKRPREPITFTGRLDHRYAPGTMAAMEVLVMPSILEEAFGMVAAEGAAAGALPLVARHSGLAEVAGALEEEVGRPGLFSFEPGPGAVGRLTRGIDGLVGLPVQERDELSDHLRGFVAAEWSWERTGSRLLAAAEPG